MPDLVRIERALLSVSDKTDLIPFAKALADMGVELISTGGTAAALQEAGLEVVTVDSLTGFPEMMDGRIKTLHPRVHGGLLARRDLDHHVQAMQTHEIRPIDLVCINLYPFERTIASGTATEAEAIEQIDIGGPAMLRSAGKNHDFVAVVTDRDQYDSLISQLRANDGCTTLNLRRTLAGSAFARTARYDATIASWMNSAGEPFPAWLHLVAGRERMLRYGENPHQQAALYATPDTRDAGLASASTIDGKPLSYNNYNDAAGALRCCRDLAHACTGSSVAVVVKHASPCGLAAADSPVEAFHQAWAGDPLAAFGGIVAMNAPMTQTEAAAIIEGERFIEVLLAPAFEQEAIEALQDRWKNIRLVAVPDIMHRPRSCQSIRTIPGGLLVQDEDDAIASPSSWKVAVGEPLDSTAQALASCAWTAVKHVPSNAVTIACGGRLAGVGGGQVDRVNAARVAVQKAAQAIAASDGPVIAASDAFFPFSDGPEVLLDAGVNCLIHPGGSKRDEDTFELCRQRGATCLLTGTRAFRH
ncbi:MAG: bifunctional phosphoribosylaminoimidazolecarboxamide formyltransferase/IMP cyclohydrolase [Phycisphaerales bacterium]|nr:bifunctional phosphoribosylaminoimidazolecarboxamide formyltransferase/IMP cyclohydrolase [Phycisphaerales bacterium]